ncbi:cytochrome c-type biogenesis protein CcmE [Thermosporothrix hazakensis]|uniref:Cytochrome c-type biogenesis protein CcmE n=2 Tax=Thermosporothrix TaxID=768650 RepID=A0A326U1K4_THEHA|nr:cytochrome c maturation protein CcmE [Thermosporothrix hazakensis]PZW23934.1 cytochrome c-type biogenesis protein CcmE [Thermosporothrix hazakensis]BBH90430.1 cytochrome C biogenesis protein CcmE [Thermosporothrix sp. COM3]GCE48467.1 cytochrome C biogenesis protein CcmE [Thermosporothrix hazakensis]
MPSAIAIEETKSIPRRSRRFPVGLLIVGLAILGAVIYLVYANTQASAAYYLTVKELRQCTSCNTRSVRVSGNVQAGSIVKDEKTNTLRFTIVEGGQTLQVVYSGVVPDIFKDGVQVVVEGHYTGSDPFQAQTLLAKCPSKFQTGTPTP